MAPPFQCFSPIMAVFFFVALCFYPLLHSSPPPRLYVLRTRPSYRWPFVTLPRLLVPHLAVLCTQGNLQWHDLFVRVPFPRLSFEEPRIVSSL